MSSESKNDDPWVWRALCADGSALDEYDENAPSGRGWADVDAFVAQRASALVGILLLPTRPTLATHVVHVTPAARARIFRRRTLSVRLTPAPDESEAPKPIDPITVIALDMLDGSTAYTFLFSDGSIVVSTDLNAV